MQHDPRRRTAQRQIQSARFVFVRKILLEKKGGRGDLRGSALGLLLLAIVLNGMIMFDIEPVFQQFVIGALLIATVAFDTLMNRHAS